MKPIILLGARQQEIAYLLQSRTIYYSFKIQRTIHFGHTQLVLSLELKRVIQPL